MHSARGGNRRETPRQRASATSSKKTRLAAWDELLKLEATERIPPPWHMRFRCAQRHSGQSGSVTSRNLFRISVCTQCTLAMLRMQGK